MNNNPPEQPEDLPDTAREVMAPVQFFGDDRMKAVEGGLQVRDFTPKVEAIDPDEEEAADRGAPSSEEFSAESDAVNEGTDPEDGDDDSPPESTPVEQPKDGDNGDDTESTATEKKAAKD